jgi:capsular exopolysaccharide synthesis family protein
MTAYLAVVRRRWWIIGGTMLVALLAAWYLTSRAERVYEATVTMRVATPANAAGSVRGDDVTYTDRLVNTYTQILGSLPVLEQVRQAAGLEARPRIGVTVPANTELMRVTASDTDPERAAAAANAAQASLRAKVTELATADQKDATRVLEARVAELQPQIAAARKEYRAALAAPEPIDARIRAAGDEVRRIEETLAEVREELQAAQLTAERRAGSITVIEDAAVPSSPASPNVPRNLAAGGLLGLLGGLGLAFLIDRSDTRLRAGKDIAEAAFGTLLGQIPAGRRGPLRGSRRPALFDPMSPQREAFRRLRTNLFALEDGEPLRTLLVASAEPNEGKTTTVANLATAVAQTGRAVLVLDCDLRAPGIHEVFGVQNDIGVADVLSGRQTLGEGIVPSGVPGVSVLPAGTSSANPTELLGSPRMAVLLEHVARNFDLVLIDSPALLAMADATALAPQVDGVLLVVRRTATRAGAVREMRRQLSIVKAPVLGVVVTDADIDATPYEHYESVVRHGG